MPSAPSRTEAALSEIRRVLKPTGRLILIEHGQAEGPRCRRWQERLNRLWGSIAGGCHLNRDPLRLIAGQAFACSKCSMAGFPCPYGSWAATTPASRRRADRASPGARSFGR
ncbi:hypothetical protein [Mesorhizobium sp. B2-4-19]|uniref:hypothetical protein n=1 Tax=Mesorhizobium sp. B2-4-19 TaxID=2589930 RepID=UPI001FEF49A5|nr:hypothetical protein [Mesorhizobium sp. B2-4-19]